MQASDPQSNRAPDAEPTALGGLPRRELAYVACATTFAVVLVLTNIIGVKLFSLFPSGRPAWMPGEGPLTLTSGILTYPLTFLLTDLVSEIWGRKRANFMVVLGFCMSVLMLGLLLIARALPPSDWWSLPELGVMDSAGMQHAFEVSFFTPHVLLFASMTAYLVAQLFDVRLYHFWWRVTRGRHMWIRNNGSTAISQLVDTIIVNSIFLHFGLGLGSSEIMQVIVVVYLCKLILAAIDTPLIYLGRAFLRRWLRIPDKGVATHAPLA